MKAKSKLQTRLDNPFGSRENAGDWAGYTSTHIRDFRNQQEVKEEASQPVSGS